MFSFFFSHTFFLIASVVVRIWNSNNDDEDDEGKTKKAVCNVVIYNVHTKTLRPRKLLTNENESDNFTASNATLAKFQRILQKKKERESRQSTLENNSIGHCIWNWIPCVVQLQPSKSKWYKWRQSAVIRCISFTQPQKHINKLTLKINYSIWIIFLWITIFFFTI